MRKREIFKIEGDKIKRLRKHCPKCGEGIYLAEHKDRFSCGSCGYTEFRSGGNKIPDKKPEVIQEPAKEGEKLGGKTRSKT
jgi:small subunit ribosomal protein S27Ae